MKDSEKRLITSLGSLVCVAGAIYIYASWISPEIVEIQKARSEKQAVHKIRADYESVLQEKIRVIARYQDLVAIQEVFSRVVPQGENMPSFLNQLYGLASLNDVSINSMTFNTLPLQTQKESSLIRPHGTIQATIRSTSTYEDMKKYLNAIETNIRIMNITAINITDGFKEDPILSYTITVETYYLAQ